MGEKGSGGGQGGGGRGGGGSGGSGQSSGGQSGGGGSQAAELQRSAGPGLPTTPLSQHEWAEFETLLKMKYGVLEADAKYKELLKLDNATQRYNFENLQQQYREGGFH